MYAALCTGGKREVATVYEVVSDKDGAVYALPDYQFTVGNTSRYEGAKTASCVPPEGQFPDTYIPVPWANKEYKFRPGTTMKVPRHVSWGPPAHAVPPTRHNSLRKAFDVL